MEPVAGGGQRTAGGLAAHRLQHHRARDPGPRLRGLRHPGPDDGPVGHRHPRPHQRHGHRGAPLPGRAPAGNPLSGRRADHQRSLDDRRADQRHNGGNPGLQERGGGGLLRQHLPCGRHRRSDTVRPGAGGVRGRAAHPHHEALRPRRDQPGPDLDRAGQRPHPRRDGGRPLRPDRLQRRGRPRPARVHGRVRPRRHRPALPRDHRPLGGGDAQRHPRDSQRSSPSRDLERRLRRADPDQGRRCRRRRGHLHRLRRLVAPERTRHQCGLQLHPCIRLLRHEGGGQP